MASARSAFQPSAEPMLRVLYWCACHHPSTPPGTVSAAGPPREGMVSLTPCAAYQPIEAARADLPAPQRAASRPAPASWISQKLSPPTPFMCGYTTAMVAAVAIAASSALPPARRAATPLAEASTCGEATMPRGARDSGQRVGGMGRFYIGHSRSGRPGQRLTAPSRATYPHTRLTRPTALVLGGRHDLSSVPADGPTRRRVLPEVRHATCVARAGPGSRGCSPDPQCHCQDGSAPLRGSRRPDRARRGPVPASRRSARTDAPEPNAGRAFPTDSRLGLRPG